MTSNVEVSVWTGLESNPVKIKLHHNTTPGTRWSYTLTIAGCSIYLTQGSAEELFNLLRETLPATIGQEPDPAIREGAEMTSAEAALYADFDDEIPF